MFTKKFFVERGIAFVLSLLSVAPNVQAIEFSRCASLHGAQLSEHGSGLLGGLWGTRGSVRLIRTPGGFVVETASGTSIHRTDKGPIIGMVAASSPDFDLVFFRTAKGFAVSRIHTTTGDIDDLLNETLRYQDQNGTWTMSPLVDMGSMESRPGEVWLLSNFQIIRVSVVDLEKRIYRPLAEASLQNEGDNPKGWAAVGMFPALPHQWYIVERRRGQQRKEIISYDVMTNKVSRQPVPGFPSAMFQNILKSHRTFRPNDVTWFAWRHEGAGAPLEFFALENRWRGNRAAGFYPVAGDMVLKKSPNESIEGIVVDSNEVAYEFSLSGGRNCIWSSVSTEFFVERMPYGSLLPTEETRIHFIDRSGQYKKWTYTK